MTDIRDARLYICEDEVTDRDLVPLDFDTAFLQATAMAAKGAHVHMMYTQDASQSLTKCASAGTPAGSVPQG